MILCCSRARSEWKVVTGQTSCRTTRARRTVTPRWCRPPSFTRAWWHRRYTDTTTATTTSTGPSPPHATCTRRRSTAPTAAPATTVHPCRVTRPSTSSHRNSSPGTREAARPRRRRLAGNWTTRLHPATTKHHAGMPAVPMPPNSRRCSSSFHPFGRIIHSILGVHSMPFPRKVTDCKRLLYYCGWIPYTLNNNFRVHSLSNKLLTLCNSRWRIGVQDGRRRLASKVIHP